MSFGKEVGKCLLLRGWDIPFVKEVGICHLLKRLEYAIW